ncbi:MAG: MFS transporter, partial [Desulfobacterales bacterium]|nr:MFS transporter [Desulfobacterales bacterium]
MSLLTMAHSMGMLMGSLIAGLTMDILDLRFAFPLGATVMAVGVLHFLITCVIHKPMQRA